MHAFKVLSEQHRRLKEIRRTSKNMQYLDDLRLNQAIDGDETSVGTEKTCEAEKECQVSRNASGQYTMLLKIRQM